MTEQKKIPETRESLFKRFLFALGVSRAPDTAEDLEQEIQELIEEGEEHGLISRQEGEMISSIFEFRETVVREIMTPGSNVVSAPLGSSPAEIVEIIKEHGFSRIPIYEDMPDHIIGILHAKDLLIAGGVKAVDPVKTMVKAPFFVRENQKITSLLREFQSKNTHMAIVTDEFASIRGLVTLEDVLEEIVGEIEDESDKHEEQWQIIDDHTIITDGKVNLEEVEDFFQVKLPDGPYESVAGFIIEQHDRVPEAGTVTNYDPLVFTVLAASNRRVISVKIQRRDAGGGD